MIDNETGLLVSDVVIVETAYVLTEVYRINRQVVVDHMVDFLQKSNINTVGIDKGTALVALLMCRPSGRISFADAMTWALVRSLDGGTVYSFDQRFPSEQINVRVPGKRE